VWELLSGRELATLYGHTDRITACLVTPDERHVVSASNDDTLKVWELLSGRVRATLHGHTEGVMACAVTPDERHVVSASNDGTLKVWELLSGRVRTTLHGHIKGVMACAVGLIYSRRRVDYVAITSSSGAFHGASVESPLLRAVS